MLEVGVGLANPAATPLPAASLPNPFLRVYSAAGRSTAGAITATGVKVGDVVLAAFGYVTATGAKIALDTTHFSITTADQIAQSSADLSANTYEFFVAVRS